MKKLGFFCACILALNSGAQDADRKWNVGFHAGLTQYNGDRGQNFYTTDQAAYGFGGLSLSYFLSDHFDATLFITRGEVGNVEPRQGLARPDEPNRFLARQNTATLAVKYNILSPSYYVRPFLFGGGSALYFEKKHTVQKERVDFSLTGGAGFTFRTGNIVSFELKETFMYTNMDNIDFRTGNGNDAFLFHSAGVMFNLGTKKDADKDGIADRKDKCPLTPGGVQVNPDGCPVDRDKDGIADYMDFCPDAAGLSMTDGCPDKDNDGIIDKMDRCPDAAGKNNLGGCPDSDGDLVADMDDKCPGTSAGYKTDANGCPVDSDKDGVLNEDDRCPAAAGSPVLKGCPDKDGDAVADMDDLCPAVRGTIANKGCPEIAKEDVKKITQIASEIYFEAGSAKLKTSSMQQLDALAAILKKYEGAHLVIEGHTDNVGEDQFNLELSQKRTDAVKEYLMSKGIFGSRMTAVGYGETRPIADNKTSYGRSKNRRVEFKTSY